MNKTYKLACIAMLTALSIVANLFTIPLSGSNSMSFTIAICFFAGIYFGPISGAVVGFMGDLIAHFIYPQGAYNIFLALSTTLFGIIAGLFFKIRLPKLVNLCISAVTCFIVCMCGLNTFGLWLQYSLKIGLVEFINMDKSLIDSTFWAYLAGRAPWSAINLVVNSVIVAGLLHSGAIAKLMTKLQRKG